MGVCRNKTGRSLAPAATLPPSMVQAFRGGAVEDLRLQRDDVRFFVGVPVNPRRATESAGSGCGVVREPDAGSNFIREGRAIPIAWWMRRAAP